MGVWRVAGLMIEFVRGVWIYVEIGMMEGGWGVERKGREEVRGRVSSWGCFFSQLDAKG